VSLDVSVRESAGITIVDLEGKATLGPDNDALSAALRKLVADGARNLVLNLAGLTQLDSAGLGSIAAAFASANRQGGNLRLLRPRGRVRAALNALKWSDYIQTFDDESQALASFGSEAQSAGS
jgi:anti-sigma B factor antagonist